MSKPLTMTVERWDALCKAVTKSRSADLLDTFKELAAVRAALAAAEANLATFGMIELAVRNPNVSSYITEWEGRALRAEAALADERRHADALLNALHNPDNITVERAIEAHHARRAAEVAPAFDRKAHNIAFPPVPKEEYRD